MLRRRHPAGTPGTFAVWALMLGALTLAMALSGTLLKRLPLSPAMLYLAVGVGLGPMDLGMLTPDPVDHAGVLEHVTEVAVLVSLFSVGLKLGAPRRSTRWAVTLRLAFGSMLLTVAFIAVVAVLLLDLDFGAAVLLGAVLAPTDPVLASDVQRVALRQVDDASRRREAGPSPAARPGRRGRDPPRAREPRADHGGRIVRRAARALRGAHEENAGAAL